VPEFRVEQVEVPPGGGSPAVLARGSPRRRWSPARAPSRHYRSVLDRPEAPIPTRAAYDPVAVGLPHRSTRSGSMHGGRGSEARSTLANSSVVAAAGRTRPGRMLVPASPGGSIAVVAGAGKRAPRRSLLESGQGHGSLGRVHRGRGGRATRASLTRPANRGWTSVATWSSDTTDTSTPTRASCTGSPRRIGETPVACSAAGRRVNWTVRGTTR
jgi:hypothetical protein